MGETRSIYRILVGNLLGKGCLENRKETKGKFLMDINERGSEDGRLTGSGIIGSELRVVVSESWLG
jgi:hypothetical protein